MADLKITKKKFAYYAETSQFDEAKQLARFYRLRSVNELIYRLLENAIDRWAVPGIDPQLKPVEYDLERQNEKDLT